jgi:hypothetical protein
MRIRFYKYQLQRLFEEGNARQHEFGYETARSTKTKHIRALEKARIFCLQRDLLLLFAKGGVLFVRRKTSSGPIESENLEK